ncbi:MAG: metallophosphoesterase family protein [Planctomycetia bacterium]|nr:metallophosphoesterase family protein [Planctomycetia bacterium]
MGRLIGISCGALVGLLFALAALPAAAGELRRAPYLLEANPAGVTVRWRTDTSSAGPALVRYGADPGKLDHAVLAIEIPSAAANAHDWSAKIEGLTPNTKYYYSVELALVTLAGGDEQHYFYTTPAAGQTEKMRFWCLGDSGSNRPRPSTAEAALKLTGPAGSVTVRTGFQKFNGNQPLRGGIVLLGDNGNPQGTDIQYQSAFFQTFGSVLQNSPLWPCVGNHDMVRNVYGQTFAVAPNQVNQDANNKGEHYPFYYSADIGNVHLVVLDPWQTWWTSNTNLNHRPWRQQVEWLEADLARNKQDWTVFANHFPVYCDGNYSSNGDGGQLALLRKELVPLCDKYGVDLFLSGHDHTYQRSYLISGNLGDSNTFNKEQHVKFAGDGRKEPIVKRAGPEGGTIYIVSGAAGGGRPSGRFEIPMMIPFTTNGKTLRGIIGPGSFVFETEGLTLRGWEIDDRGNVVDNFTVVKQK